MTDTGTTRITEEEYYELLREARNCIPPHRDGCSYIYERRVRRGRKYRELTYYDWFTGPWLRHHTILFDLEKEYGK